MKLVGLTGGIASGKSTVSKLFLEFGIPVIDSDKIAREVVDPGQPLLNKLEKEFGKHILMKDGTLNRKKLGTIVFNDNKKLNKLNELTHPVIRERIIVEIEKYKVNNYPCCVIDVPLLIESKFYDMVDVILLVYVDRKTQLSRLILRENYSEAEALSRINSQMDIEEKKKFAGYIIDNTQSIEYTRQQIMQFIKTVCLMEGLNG